MKAASAESAWAAYGDFGNRTEHNTRKDFKYFTNQSPPVTNRALSNLPKSEKVYSVLLQEDVMAMECKEVNLTVSGHGIETGCLSKSATIFHKSSCAFSLLHS